MSKHPTLYTFRSLVVGYLIRYLLREKLTHQNPRDYFKNVNVDAKNFGYFINGLKVQSCKILRSKGLGYLVRLFFPPLLHFGQPSLRFLSGTYYINFVHLLSVPTTLQVGSKITPKISESSSVESSSMFSIGTFL